MSTARHATVEPDDTEPVEQTKGAPERYQPEVRERGRILWLFPTYEVDLVTTHYLPIVGEKGEPVEALFSPSRLVAPYVVLGEWWAKWKGRRLVAAALKKDLREGQPWAVVQ